MAVKAPTTKVTAVPAKPLMVFDGDCRFCRFWIVRWQQATGNKVDYIESQDASVASRFPELSKERFEKSVQLIETDGTVYGGAEAVFRALRYARFQSWAFWMYESVPGFAAVTEWMYRLVAGNREVFSW